MRKHTIANDIIAEIRQIDLLTYLRVYEPDNLVRISANVYCTRDHDSLKISNGKWYWWSRGFGGASALDYLITVKGIPFRDAAMLLQEMKGIAPRNTTEKHVHMKAKTKKLHLPEPNSTHLCAMHYLVCYRHLDQDIIKACIDTGILYESAYYHNVVFVGKDENGVPRYAACRGTIPSSNFKQDVSGSDKRFSFRLVSKQPSTSLHLFEAAIDLLSYATYLKLEGNDYRKENLLSLSGVYQRRTKLPAALTNFLHQHQEIQTIYLHLDNDIAGRASTDEITAALQNQYTIIDAPPLSGKDWNDYLQNYLKSENQDEK